MKRIKILNKRIEQIFRKKQDQDLILKLKTIKPAINIKCPESYLFHKTIFNSYKTEPKKLEQKLSAVNIKKRKKVKLIIKAVNKKENNPLSIFTSNNKNNNNNKHNLLKHFVSGKSIFETSKIYDENMNLSKRIKEKSSYYSLSQWKKDFKKSRIYKKISCEFPSINFVGSPKKKSIIKRNLEMSPIKFINNFNDVKFIPINSFSSDNKRNESNVKDKAQNNTLDKLRRIKFTKLFEENNKVIFNKKLNTNKKFLSIENTFSKV